MAFKSYKASGGGFGPMRAGSQSQGVGGAFTSILAFAAAFQGIPASTIQGVAMDKLISDAHPLLRIPTLEQVLPRL